MNTTDYKTNKQLQTVRRLYVPDDVKKLSGRQYMAYNERFIKGFEEIKDDPHTKELLKDVEDYLQVSRVIKARRSEAEGGTNPAAQDALRAESRLRTFFEARCLLAVPHCRERCTLAPGCVTRVRSVFARVRSPYLLTVSRVISLPPLLTLASLMQELEDAKWLDKELRLIQRVVGQYGVLTAPYVLGHFMISFIAAPLCTPGMILMMPVMKLSTMNAVKEQAKALAGSKVKVGAYDVVASEMVKWAMTYAPLFWILYTIVGGVLANVLILESHSAGWQTLEWIVPIALLLGMPVFCFYSIRLSDVAFFSYKKATIVARRFRPKGKKMMTRREEMQLKVREFVKANSGGGAA